MSRQKPEDTMLLIGPSLATAYAGNNYEPNFQLKLGSKIANSRERRLLITAWPIPWIIAELMAFGWQGHVANLFRVPNWNKPALGGVFAKGAMEQERIYLARFFDEAGHETITLGTIREMDTWVYVMEGNETYPRIKVMGDTTALSRHVGHLFTGGAAILLARKAH